MASFYSEMFDTRVRYSGTSVGYQLGTVFAGGLAPIIATALLDRTGTSLSVSAYMLAMITIFFAAMLSAPETHRRNVEETQAEHVAAADNAS